MATIGEFDFTKDWRDSDDFPTREYSESQVREDIQYLFDELKDYLNNNVASAINNHESRIAALGGGGQVEHDSIADYAIEENNLADGSITELKYSPDSIPAGILQDESVKADNLDQETVDPYINNLITEALDNMWDDLDMRDPTGPYASLFRSMIIYVVSTTPLGDWWGVYD